MPDPQLAGLSATAETLLTFLESVGRPSEAEFYLGLFRKLPKESFAIVVMGEAALSSLQGSIVEQLRFLADLDLRVAIVLGAWSKGHSDAAAETLALAWIGRGTYDVSEWDDAFAEASDLGTDERMDELLDMPLLASHLESGLAAFDFSCEGLGQID